MYAVKHCLCILASEYNLIIHIKTVQKKKGFNLHHGLCVDNTVKGQLPPSEKQLLSRFT